MLYQKCVCAPRVDSGECPFGLELWQFTENDIRVLYPIRTAYVVIKVKAARYAVHLWGNILSFVCYGTY